MEALLSRITALEGELRTVNGEKNRFRQLVIETEGELERRQSEIERQQSAFADLQKRYAEERSRRIQLELGGASPSSANPSLNSLAALSSNSQSHVIPPIPPTSESPMLPSVTDSEKAAQVPRTPPKLKQLDSPEAKVTIKLSPSIPRKSKVEPSATDKKRKIAATTDDDQKGKHDSPEPDAAPTKRQRRPVQANSRLPITMAERQGQGKPKIPDASPAISTTSGNTSQKAATQASSVTSRRRIIPVDPSSSPEILPSIPHSTEPSSSKKATITRRPGTPSELILSPNDSQGEDDVPQAVVARKSKPYVLIQTDRKGKGKAKTEAHFTLDGSETSTYLNNAQVFSIRPPPLDVQISRRALTDVYGLPGMGFLWKSKNKKHPFKFMLPDVSLNPDMPRSPGAPGLLLSCREEMLKDGPWTLFVKTHVNKKIRLNYAGEYTCKKVGKMTAEEFSAQDQAVKIEWGKKIATHKKYTSYRVLRARITVRSKLGIEPTEEQIEDEFDRISSKNYMSPLSAADVVEAFERGEEHISVIRLECDSYNHERAQAFIKAQEDFDRREREKSNPSKVEPRKKILHKKRSRHNVSSGSEDETDERSESEDDSGD